MNAFDRSIFERKVAKEFRIPERHACVVGSTLICGKGNDVDVLCLVPREEIVEAAGYRPDIEVEYESDLRSYRKDGVNIIATTSPNFFFAEVAIASAAAVIAMCKFNMSDRDSRVDFHSTVRTQVLARLHDDEITY